MPTIRISKEQLKAAQRARKAALEKDPKLRALDEKLKEHLKKAAQSREREEGS